MKYMGSKRRIANEILPIILNNRECSQWYVEPFVGGFNTIDKVSGNRIANDSNPYLIELFKAIQSGWEPPDSISEIEYKDIKNNKDKYPPHIVGFVGFGCSYAGKFFGGYARGGTRNYCLESKNNLLRQKKHIDGIILYNKHYTDFHIPANSLIYCDPPYRGSTQYNNKFDSDEFWDWVRYISGKGHIVYVSEYEAPLDFICLWQKKINNTLVQNTGDKQGIEKLFTRSN